METNKFIRLPIEDIMSKLEIDREIVRDCLLTYEIYHNKALAMRAVKKASSYFRYHSWDIHGWVMVHNGRDYLYFYDHNSLKFDDN